MPEIVLPGLRHVGGGSTESQHKMLEEMRKSEQVQVWAQAGSEQECEASWREFLLQGTPNWIIYS